MSEIDGAFPSSAAGRVGAAASAGSDAGRSSATPGASSMIAVEGVVAHGARPVEEDAPATVRTSEGSPDGEAVAHMTTKAVATPASTRGSTGLASPRPRSRPPWVFTGSGRTAAPTPFLRGRARRSLLRSSSTVTTLARNPARRKPPAWPGGVLPTTTVFPVRSTTSTAVRAESSSSPRAGGTPNSPARVSMDKRTFPSASAWSTRRPSRLRASSRSRRATPEASRRAEAVPTKSSSIGPQPLPVALPVPVPPVRFTAPASTGYVLRAQP